MGYELLSGKDKIYLEDVVHLLVPGRGRAGSGDRLTKVALERVKFAAKLYKELDLQARGGMIITSGYKSPADSLGVPGIFRRGYDGVPEAELLKRQLIKEGMPAEKIRTENDSIDTAMNLTYVEYGSYFPDDNPVGIIAQQSHLNRIIHRIAPHVLRRKYVGIIAPEVAAGKDNDTWLAWFASWFIMRGMKPGSSDAKDTVQKRAAMLWKIARFLPLTKDYHLEKD